MSVVFEHQPHPRIAAHAKAKPPKQRRRARRVQWSLALLLTTAVGTMWCAYAFAVLALVALPSALGGGLFPLIQWVSQTFIPLIMLSVIMVGQNILSRADDKRADMTYQDADATFHEAEQIQAHLKAQDEAINEMLDKLQKLVALSARDGPSEHRRLGGPLLPGHGEPWVGHRA